jgi:alkylation response protein AidB-like acyl-CoA dehydrogenase
MGELGMLSMDLPERYGGIGVDAVTTGAIIEQLAYGDGVDGAPTGIDVCQDALSDPSEGSRP